MSRTKHDKIFDNSFESTEFELNTNITFNVSPRYADDRPEEDKIEQKALQIDIHELIEKSRFNTFNKLDEFSDTVKLKKADINEVYEYIEGELISTYSRIDIFSELTDYFNVNPTKFYSSLANSFKEGLIEELDRKTGILKTKNINRLF
tara:strand:- start:771 stop:1217 length:447 start_codon:yes stop_codon:yes gene_type:complete